MTDVKKLQTLDGMLDYPDPNDASKGTTEQQFQEYLKNHYAVMYSLVSMALWQPGTNYIKGQVVLSPNMPANTIARVTAAGSSGAAEPVWGSVGSTISDGTVTYIMLPRTIDFASQAEVTAGKVDNKIVTPASMQALITAIYAKAKLDAHPVGSIYESTSAESPASLFGGTWEEMEAGLVLVSQGTAKSGTVFTAGDTGGEEKHTLNTGELPVTNINVSGATSLAGEHTHAIRSPGNKADEGSGIGRGYDWEKVRTYYTESAGAHTHTFTGTGTFGGGSSHNVMQPYTVVYRWRRTA